MNIQTQRLVDSLNSILRIHSPSKQESACAQFLQKHFSKYSAQIDTAGNVIVRIPGTGEPLLLCAHMDVVDPSDKIDTVVTDGYIRNKEPYIMGIDNKSTIACIMETVAVLEETGATHRPLEIVFTTEEETMGNGAENLPYETLLSKQGLIADSALPVGGIILKSPFYGMLDITFSGPTHHTKNITANEQTAWKIMSEVLGQLPTGKISEATNINWSKIEGGTGRNTVTEKFSVRGEIRSFDKTDYENTIAQIQKITGLNEPTIVFKHALITQGYVIDEANPWLTKISETLTKNGASVSLITDYGLSDANVLINKGIMAINISSGAQNTHTKDETIAIKDMETVTKVIIELASGI